VEEAWRWYESRREGLGDGVGETLEAVRAHPEAAPVVHRDIRRRLLRRFPYGLFYRLIEGQVVVVACFHASRSPECGVRDASPLAAHFVLQPSQADRRRHPASDQRGPDSRPRVWIDAKRTSASASRCWPV
jgi:plasmid stabilization system protein ParE